MRQLFQNLINNAIKYRKKILFIKISAEIDSSDLKITMSTDCFLFVEENGTGSIKNTPMKFLE